jgi:hypothetical protein
MMAAQIATHSLHMYARGRLLGLEISLPAFSWLFPQKEQSSELSFELAGCLKVEALVERIL